MTLHALIESQDQSEWLAWEWQVLGEFPAIAKKEGKRGTILDVQGHAPSTLHMILFHYPQNPVR